MVKIYWFHVFLLSVFLSGTFTSTDILLKDLDFIEVTFYRVLISFHIIFLIFAFNTLFFKKKIKFKKKNFSKLFLASFLILTAPFLLIAKAQTMLSPTITVISLMSPALFSSIISTIFLKKYRFKLTTKIFILISFFGIFSALKFDNYAYSIHSLFLLLAGLSIAFGSLLITKKIKELDFSALSFWLIFFSLITVSVILSLTHINGITLPTKNIVPMFSLGILGTGLGTIMLLYILKSPLMINPGLAVSIVPIYVIIIEKEIQNKIIDNNLIYSYIITVIGTLLTIGVLKFKKAKKNDT